MPGFNVNGIGGGGVPNTMEVRRKHRWVFEVILRGEGTPFSTISRLMLQSASRPSFKFEQPEMHHNQEVVRFAGKQDWDPITLVWYDGEQKPDISADIYYWLETVVNMTTIQVAHPEKYKKFAQLAMVGGMALVGGMGATAVSERWELYGTWPAEINWQELDYTSTDLMTIEATMRYDRAIRSCQNSATNEPVTPACPPGM